MIRVIIFGDSMDLNFSETLRKNIRSNLAEFDVEKADSNGLRRAAVACILLEAGLGPNIEGMEENSNWSLECALLLTRRIEGLRNHGGQWAFPGGKLDGAEEPLEAAIREAREEVGVELSASHLIGALDDFVTRSGFIMSPFVFWADKSLQPVPAPSEVASIHRIPLTEFCRDDAPRLSRVSTSVNPVLRMPVGSDSIAAPTAAIIYQLKEVCLFGRPTRVAHFEQPEFAWR